MEGAEQHGEGVPHGILRPSILRLGVGERGGRGATVEASRAERAAAVDDALPDGGLPRGAVVELSAPRGLGGVTSLALTACAAAQREARFRAGNERTLGAMCGFVDPWATLHAPALLQHAVDVTRLIVVRPPLGSLARVCVRMAESKAFSVLSIDLKGVPGARTAEGEAEVALDRWSTVVRRLAIAIEHTDTTVLLLTDRLQRRAMPLPVALRLEVDRAWAPSPVEAEHDAPRWRVFVAKDRLGRVSLGRVSAGRSSAGGAVVPAGVRSPVALSG